MNSKKTNRLVVVLNSVTVIFSYILLLYFYTGNISLGTYFSGNVVVNAIVKNLKTILAVVHCSLAVINIIGAIQNKDNKKILFWNVIFSICEILATIIFSIGEYIEYDLLLWGCKLIFGIIPIIITIINLILSKRKKVKLIKLISYICVIIISIFALSNLKLLSNYIYTNLLFILCWDVISVIMQLIYIKYQDNDMFESKKRRTFNIIVYYVLELIFTVIFVGVSIYFMIITSIYSDSWKSQTGDIYNGIMNLNNNKIEEVYIPVVKNNKYGFINENGEEKIACEYDLVTYFHEINVDNISYYFAFAEEADEYYIISKNNDKILLEENLKESIKNILNNEISQEQMKLAPITTLGNAFFNLLAEMDLDISIQVVTEYDNENEISLEKKENKYYYKNNNYAMIIEPITEEIADEEDYNYYDIEENTFHISVPENNTLYNVSIYKENGENTSNTVYLPEMNIYYDEATIKTFSDGSIGYETEDQTRTGWYDNKGNQTTVPSLYEIIDIINDKVILYTFNSDNDVFEENYMIIDPSGNILLKTKKLEIYDKMYLVKKDNGKNVLMDKRLNEITNDYDRIITNLDIEMNWNL